MLFNTPVNGGNEYVFINRIIIVDGGQAIEPPMLNKVRKALIEVKYRKLLGG